MWHQICINLDMFAMQKVTNWIYQFFEQICSLIDAFLPAHGANLYIKGDLAKLPAKPQKREKPKIDKGYIGAPEPPDFCPGG